MLQNTEISKIFGVEARGPMICEKTHKIIGSASMRINAKLKMHKNANSKCTILAKHRLEEYTSPGRCEYERAKGHFREGEAFNEREF